MNPYPSVTPAIGSTTLPTHLPSDEATQLLIARYICVATLSAWLWDFFLDIDRDVSLFRSRTRRIVPSYIIYCFCRTFSLLTIVSIFSCAFMESTDCNSMVKLAAAANGVSASLSSLLMYFRVYAVYHHSPLVKTLFGIMWLGVVGASVPETVVAQGISIARQCIPTDPKTYGAAGVVASAVVDSLIFLALSYRLVEFHSPGGSRQARFKEFIRGDGLHKTSKVLLQTGQLYYAATIGMNILAVIALAPNLAPILGTGLSIPAFTMTANMACKAYRSTRLGLIKRDLFPSATSMASRLSTLAATTSE